MIITPEAFTYQDNFSDDNRHDAANPEEYRVLRVTPDYTVVVVHFKASDHDEILTYFVTLQLRHDPSDGRTMLYYGWRHDNRINTAEPLRDDLTYYLNLLDNPERQYPHDNPEPPGGWTYIPFTESVCETQDSGRWKCE